MATIVTRAGKGSPLTNSEVDANFTNLNTDKLETVPVASASTSGTVKIGAGVSIDGAGVLTSTGATNLSNTPASTNVALESSTGANTTLPAATQSAAGVLSAADKTKLDGGAGSTLNADLLDGQHGSYYTSYADTAVSNLVDSSPDALNTLNELAAALGDDANFSTTITDSVATKLPKSGGAMTGAITTNSTFDGRDVATDGTKLDTIATNANNYAHPTGNGNQHIPAGGSTGKYLKYASAGTAQWSDNELAVTNFEYTATANQTTFSGSDNNSATLAYTVNNIIVSLNGIILDGGTDYTSSNGTSIVLASGAAVGDHFAVVAFSAFSTSDTVSATSGGTFGANVGVTGNITVTGTVDGRDLQTDGTKLDGVAASANNYVHPTTNGNKHVPAGGSANQVLTYASAGTAQWASPAVGFAHTLNSGNPTATINPSAVGHMWINTTSGEAFICTNATANANAWVSLGVGATATIVPFAGGIVTSYGIYTVHTFLTSGSFVIAAGVTKNLDYLIVAGGGGGGAANGGGGGGGAGGLLTGQKANASGTNAVVVGAGGAGGDHTHTGNNNQSSRGTSGSNSSALGFTAIGGGGGGGDSTSGGGNASGGAYGSDGLLGGSGGGGGRGYGTVGGAGTSGQGNAGGNTVGNSNAGGGGGGAGAAGSADSTGGAGGAGLSNSLRTGSGVFYAGGGGGGKELPSGGGAGGSGGGGSGGNHTTGSTDGTANTGGGGGGSGDHDNGPQPRDGNAGGSGIVVIRYET